MQRSRVTLSDSFLILLFLASVSCSNQSVIPGQTTESELRAQLGEPVREGMAKDRPQAKLMDYSNGCSYQIENKLLVSSVCPPTEQENVLQYWRHQWLGSPQIVSELPQSKDAHGPKIYQLISKQHQMSVIYEENSGRVLSVVRYGPR